MTAAAGSTGIRLSSISGRTAGEKLYLGTGANQELVTIDRIVPDPVADAPAPNVMLQAALKKTHEAPAQNGVFTTYRSIAVMIDSFAPVAAYPVIVDGKHVYPFPQALNKYTTGKHSQMLVLQDVAGNAIQQTTTFAVTTSFADLDAVLTQYTSNALSTTLGAAAEAGASQETVTIASVPSPPPAREGANVVLSSPLKQASEAGDADDSNLRRPDSPCAHP